MDFQQLAALSTPEHRRCRLDGLSLFEAQDHRWVCTDAAPPLAIQTAMCMSRPEDPVLPNHRAMADGLRYTPVKRVLDLGLGGGACYRAVMHRVPEVEYTAIEADAAMLSLARDYLALPMGFPVIVDDALRWIRGDRGEYGLILCDLFIGDRAPAALQSAEAYEAISARLCPGGLAAVNCLPDSNSSLRALGRLLCRVFAGVAIVSFTDLGNVVFYLRQQPFVGDTCLQERQSAAPGTAVNVLR